MRLIYLLLFIGCLPLSLFSQTNWELGLVLGATGYQGDINIHDRPDEQAVDLAYGLFLRRNMTANWAVRFNYLRGTWRGDDQFAAGALRQQRGFSFANRLQEGSILLEWDPFGKSRFKVDSLRFRPRITPYSYFGLGFAHYSLDNQYPLDLNSAMLERVRVDKLSLEQTFFISIPMGVGLKVDLGKKATLALELGLHYGNNDLLDGVSLAGNPNARDWFWHGGVNYAIRLMKKDSDGDGILDSEDACKYLAGALSANGCPDRDGDGVEDTEDVCPDLPGPIEFSGCPDSDGDGVMDPADECPDLFGTEATKGCPDGDLDGVKDSEDLCPTAIGLPENQGCPDQDNDGLLDHLDQCPQEKGLPENGGCPLYDRDCDGVIDLLDACPDLPDTLSFSGCPDLDEDGILDSLDLCPEVPGVIGNQGCPEMKEEEKEVLSFAEEAVRFQTGNANLRPESKGVLDKIKVILEEYPYYDLSIKGHTDDVGRAELNQSLSERRAKSCYTYLLSQGIPEERMKFAGFGETDPIADNKTSVGRAKNRRVEFRMVFGGTQN